MSFWIYACVFLAIGIPYTLVYRRLLRESGQPKPVWPQQMVGIWIAHKRHYPDSHVRIWFLLFFLIEIAWVLVAAGGFVR